MSFLKNVFEMKKNQLVTLFLSANAVLGIILFALFIIPRSEAGNRLILGLSTSRVIIAIIFFGFLLINFGVILLANANFGSWQKEFERKGIRFFLDHQIILVTMLYAVFILTGAFLLLIIPPVIRPLTFLMPVRDRLGGFLGWIFFASTLLIILLHILDVQTLVKESVIAQLDQILILAGLFLLTFVLYAQFAALIGWINKTKYSFWDLLAGAFMQGRLYLKNPPYTHDLTLFKGNWYVPMPPLPAILMMPLAYLIGAENISTSYLSMVFSAINGILVYLILSELNKWKWIQISTAGIFLLVTIFLFGTPHFWVGFSGRGWYVSQILTVLFLALATYSALRSWSAWWVGAFIAIAMTARPNSLMTWPFVFAIAMQILKETEGKINLKQALFWSLKTIPPIALAVAGLLTYNYLRFENILDFGYTTVNAGPDIVQNVQTWGMFSPHFVPINLMVMFFKLPRFPLSGLWPVEPSTTGMSIFLTTPVLIYLFHRYPKQWWVIGAWVAIIFNIALLSLYSNTGAHQFGYRYILDMLVPLIAMLAVGMSRKIPWHFIALVVVSIVINMYGANWFMNA